MSAEQELAIARQMHDAYRQEINLWQARYMAAHDVLLHVEDFCKNFLTPEGTIFMDRFFALRAAFLAYRAAIEARAPLGWAVAEEPAEVEG